MPSGPKIGEQTIRSASLPVIQIFIYATLLAFVLAHDISAHMRRARPGCEPSLQRVAMLVLAYLPMIASRIGTRRLRPTVAEFEMALWREGLNPNPGRPYATNLYANRARAVT